MASEEVAILLVEDSPAIQEGIIDLIEEDPRCRIAYVTDAESAAIAELQSGRYEIAIIDLQIREGSGQGVLKFLGTQLRPMLKIVLTNFDRPQVRAQCMALGADYFFDKSREFEKVAEAIDAWLAARAAGGSSSANA